MQDNNTGSYHKIIASTLKADAGVFGFPSDAGELFDQIQASIVVTESGRRRKVDIGKSPLDGFDSTNQPHADRLIGLVYTIVNSDKYTSQEKYGFIGRVLYWIDKRNGPFRRVLYWVDKRKGPFRRVLYWIDKRKGKSTLSLPQATSRASSVDDLSERLSVDGDKLSLGSVGSAVSSLPVSLKGSKPLSTRKLCQHLLLVSIKPSLSQVDIDDIADKLLAKQIEKGAHVTSFEYTNSTLKAHICQLAAGIQADITSQERMMWERIDAIADKEKAKLYIHQTLGEDKTSVGRNLADMCQRVAAADSLSRVQTFLIAAAGTPVPEDVPKIYTPLPAALIRAIEILSNSADGKVFLKNLDLPNFEELTDQLAHYLVASNEERSKQLGPRGENDINLALLQAMYLYQLPIKVENASQRDMDVWVRGAAFPSEQDPHQDTLIKERMAHLYKRMILMALVDQHGEMVFREPESSHAWIKWSDHMNRISAYSHGGRINGQVRAKTIPEIQAFLDCMFGDGKLLVNSSGKITTANGVYFLRGFSSHELTKEGQELDKKHRSGGQVFDIGSNHSLTASQTADYTGTVLDTSYGWSREEVNLTDGMHGHWFDYGRIDFDPKKKEWVLNFGSGREGAAPQLPTAFGDPHDHRCKKNKISGAGQRKFVDLVGTKPGAVDCMRLNINYSNLGVSGLSGDGSLVAKIDAEYAALEHLLYGPTATPETRKAALEGLFGRTPYLPSTHPASVA